METKRMAIKKKALNKSKPIGSEELKGPFPARTKTAGIKPVTEPTITPHKAIHFFVSSHRQRKESKDPMSKNRKELMRKIIFRWGYVYKFSPALSMTYSQLAIDRRALSF